VKFEGGFAEVEEKKGVECTGGGEEPNEERVWADNLAVERQA
jgi:hypothetical protein